jgi:hypothetical protein
MRAASLKKKKIGGAAKSNVHILPRSWEEKIGGKVKRVSETKDGRKKARTQHTYSFLCSVTGNWRNWEGLSATRVYKNGEGLAGVVMEKE